MQFDRMIKYRNFIFTIFTRISLFLLLPFLAQASSLTDSGYANDSDFDNLITNILKFSNNILIPFILGIGFLVFVWGMFQYFIVGGASDDQKEKGKNLAIYSVLAFVLVIVFWGIINLIVGTLGLSKGADGTKQTFTVPGGVTSRSSSEAAEGDGTCGGDLVTGELIDC